MYVKNSIQIKEKLNTEIYAQIKLRYTHADICAFIYPTTVKDPFFRERN